MDNAKTKKSKKIVAIVLVAILTALIITGSILLIVYFSKKVKYDSTTQLELKEGCSDLYYNILNDNQQKMYRMICNEAQSILDGNKSKSSLGIYKFEDYGVDRDEAIVTMYAVKFDCPAYFIISNEYVEIASSIELKVYPEFSNKKNRQNALAIITSSVQEVKEILNGVEDDVLKFKLIYDYVMSHTSYMTDENGEAIHNGYTCSIAGVLGDEKYRGSICQGYAKTLSFLCNLFGVDCAYVDSPRINHALNIVKIEDEWYYADSTSDDNDNANYSYFLKGFDNYWKDVTRDVEDSNKSKMLSCLPTLPSNDHDKNFTVGYLDYFVFNRTTCSITNCSEDAESVVIPSDDLYGMTIKEIDAKTFENCDKLSHIEISELVSKYSNMAFSRCSKLTSVKIADGVKSLALRAFSNCTALKSVELPSSLESIESEAFYGCSSLQEINIPQNVTIIDSMAFYDCISLTKLQLPENLKEIDNNCFSFCRGLTDFIFPQSLESIGHHAFIGCSKLKNLDIPKNVGYIGQGAFASCDGLDSIIIRSTDFYKESYVFEGCSNVKSATVPMMALGSIPRFNLQNVVITSGGMLSSYYFEDCINLMSVKLPSTMTYISDNAFLRCSNLTNIEIPSSVTHIGRYAFRECSNLQSIKIPDGVTDIAEGTFYECGNLREINLNNVTSIGKQAFENCFSLSNIEIDSIQSIGEQAFSNCKIRSIFIPISAVDVGRIIFYGCGNMTIYCEADSKPVGWHDDWSVNNITQFNVVWGYKDV